MTGFSVCEDTPRQSAESFAAALMKIWLRFGFSHTIVVDKDSKFRATFEQTAALLKINIHVLSGGNHDPMLVERVIRYLNKALKIFCTERGTVKVALEAILLSLYAWNSAPVPATDLSRSLLTVGREFQFPIDFCLDKHRSLVSTPDRVTSFAKEQAKLLAASRFLGKHLIEEHRSMSREIINQSRPDPKIYQVGQRVFARRAIKSKKSSNVVAKVKYAYTGPWTVQRRLDGSSYEIKHVQTGKLDKKHAAFLSPFPHQLLPLLPVDGPDNLYGQLNAQLQPDAYYDAGIQSFIPGNPYKESEETVLLSLPEPWARQLDCANCGRSPPILRADLKK